MRHYHRESIAFQVKKKVIVSHYFEKRRRVAISPQAISKTWVGTLPLRLQESVRKNGSWARGVCVVAASGQDPPPDRSPGVGRFAAVNRQRRGLGKPETFAFLGFSFICGKSSKGGFQIKRKTRADRMRAKLKQVKEGLRQRMHRTIAEQGRWLGQVVAGYFRYFAVPTNPRALSAFRYHTLDLWRRTLKRRSQQDRTKWDRMSDLAREFLPTPRVLHPWPSARFAVKHPRWEPYAGKPPVRFCAGGVQ
jgi:RNA-directed DNA polymerase